MSRRFPFMISVDCTKLHDLVSDFDKNHSVEITELQNLELVVGELQKNSPGRFGEFRFSTEGNWSKAVIDVLTAVEKSKREKNAELMRKKIHEYLTLSLAHESGHWYMFHTDRKTLLNSGKTMEKILRIFFGVFMGMTIVIAGAILFDIFSITHFSSQLGANVCGGILTAFSGLSFYIGLWTAQMMAKDFAYILSRPERFARKFEKWAKKDARWNEIVSVEWNK